MYRGRNRVKIIGINYNRQYTASIITIISYIYINVEMCAICGQILVVGRTSSQAPKVLQTTVLDDLRCFKALVRPGSEEF